MCQRRYIRYLPENQRGGWKIPPVRTISSLNLPNTRHVTRLGVDWSEAEMGVFTFQMC